MLGSTKAYCDRKNRATRVMNVVVKSDDPAPELSAFDGFNYVVDFEFNLAGHSLLPFASKQLRHPQ